MLFVVLFSVIIYLHCIIKERTIWFLCLFLSHVILIGYYVLAVDGDSGEEGIWLRIVARAWAWLMPVVAKRSERQFPCDFANSLSWRRSGMFEALQVRQRSR